MKIACCIFAYEITKGLKSLGPLGSLRRNAKVKPFILEQINYVRDIFGGVDFYIITGFENAKIENTIPNKKYIKTIYNKKYYTKNHGLAIKLFFDEINDQLDKYEGFLILEQNSLVKNTTKNKKQSWINTKTKTKNDRKTNNIDTISIDHHIKYLFYQLDGNTWCHNLYLTSKDLQSIIASETSIFHDNMFLFECINAIIENTEVTILENKIVHNKDHIHFTSPKIKKVICKKIS